MTTKPQRLTPALSLIIAGGVLALVAIVSRPGDTQAQPLQLQPLQIQPEHSEAPRNLMIDERPVLGELQGEDGTTVILGGDEISYLDAGPAGELYDSTLDRDNMLAEPTLLMLVDLPEEW